MSTNKTEVVSHHRLDVYTSIGCSIARSLFLCAACKDSQTVWQRRTYRSVPRNGIKRPNHTEPLLLQTLVPSLYVSSAVSTPIAVTRD